MSVVQGWLRQGIVPAPLARQLVLLAQPDLLLAVNGLRVWPGGVELRLELCHLAQPVGAGRTDDLRRPSLPKLPLCA